MFGSFSSFFWVCHEYVLPGGCWFYEAMFVLLFLGNVISMFSLLYVLLWLSNAAHTLCILVAGYTQPLATLCTNGLGMVMFYVMYVLCFVLFMVYSNCMNLQVIVTMHWISVLIASGQNVLPLFSNLDITGTHVQFV